jgi:type VI secretion system protein ImpG
MIEKYYEEELRYLYESGKQFAKAHPDRAPFLNIDAVGDRDPYVERLFEGFAFLAARVREKLDDTFPELTEGLFDLMWPQFLQEIPSVTIAQFRPRTGLLQETKKLPRGSEILSNPAGPEAVTCKFLTTQDIALNPISYDALERSVDSRGNTTLKLHFSLDAGVQLEHLDVTPLRLYLYAELPTAMMLHQFMTMRAKRAWIELDQGERQVEIDAREAVRAGGMASNETLLQGDARCFRGYELLLEYFVFPEKFLFVDLYGCAAIPYSDPPVTEFTYCLTLDGEMPDSMPFNTETFRLFCSPVINLFPHDTVPVTRTGKRTEYRVVADATYQNSIFANSVISVTGVDRVTGERFVYEPFHSFKTIGNTKGRTYTSRYVRSPDGQRQISLMIGGEQLDKEQLHEESLSIRAWCSNGEHAREDLREGAISKPGKDFPDFVMISNLFRPTLPCRPPEQKDYLWMFLSHLGTAYSTLADAENFKAFLRLYNWSNAEGKNRRIDAIQQVEAHSAEMAAAGSVIRGVKFSVSLLSAEFDDSGDLHLFGEIIKEFLAQYVSINSFVELEFICKPSGKTIRWNSAAGKRWLI